MEKETGVDFKEIFAAGAATGEVKTVSATSRQDKHFMLVPDGYMAKEVEFDFKGFADTPLRNTGTIHLASVDSFNRFVSRELVEGTTVCFADLENKLFKVVFNYSADGRTPGWGDRIAILGLQHGTKWNRWVKCNEIKMNQLAFTDFIEANLDDIINPASADIIEMTKNLKVHKKAEFSSIVDPKTGFTSLAFSETISGETIKGNFDFIGKMELALAPFRGMAPYGVTANIRFQINEETNKMQVYYSMINADIVIEHAFDSVLNQIKAHMETIGVPIFDV